MRNFKLLAYLLTGMALTGCGSLSFNTSPGGTTVKSRQPAKTLEVPPDLVSGTSEQVTAARFEESVDRREVLPESYATKLIEDGDNRWLEIEAKPQVVWHRLVRYWEALGVGLVVSQPGTGTMETGWISPERRPGILSSLFAGLNDSGYDKYRLRLERGEQDKTNLYVDHTWAEKILVTYPQKDAEAAWVESKDPGKALALLKAVAFEMDPSQILGGS